MSATPTDGVTRAPLADRKDDLYETPPEAVWALLDRQMLPEHVWEPACGPGSIVRTLREAGYTVTATDLVDYASPDQDKAGWDFLMEGRAPQGVGAICTNPPFKLARDFALKGLALCPLVILLLRLQFLEGAGLERSRLLDDSGLEKVYVFANRLPRMHRDGWEGKRATSRTAFAWYVWRRGYCGPVELSRIKWKTRSNGG